MKEKKTPMFTKTTEITNLGWVDKKPNAEHLFFMQIGYTTKELAERIGEGWRLVFQQTKEGSK